MDFQYLFTSFDGRINRAKYWAGIVILAIISIVLGFIIGAVMPDEAIKDTPRDRARVVPAIGKDDGRHASSVPCAI